MKNIKNLFKVILLLFIVSSCDDDEFVPPNEFVDVAFTSSLGLGAKEVDVNDYSGFLDLSSGATYHEWRIPKTAFFLKGPIPGNATNLDEFIINPGDTITNDRTALVLFKEADSVAKITIYNEFDEYTEFILNTGFDPVAGSTIIDTTRTELINGKWVYEYTLTIDVYDTIVPDMAIRDIDGNPIDYRNLSSIDLKFNDKLIFEDLSETTNNARPTSTRWRVHTIEDNEDDEINIFNGTTKIDTITFNKQIGSFRGKLTSNRDRTETIKADSEIFDIPVVFNVTALDESFTQTGSVEELPDGTIQVPLSSIVADIGSSPVASFTVNVNGSPATINSVIKSNTAGNTLIVTLETDIQETDVVTISYDGNGGLQSLDERPLQAFSNVAVANYIVTPVIQTGTIIELRDETIQVPFDVDFDPDTFTGDTTQGFEVLVNGISFSIASVSIDNTDNKVLNINLTDPIYRPDVITVGHDGSGDIRAIGGGAIGAFTGVPVIMDNGDILNGDGSFDDSSKWNNNSGNGTSSITFPNPAVPANNPDTGAVAFVEAPDGNKPDLRSSGTYPFEAGKTYVWTAKRYIFTAHTTTFAKPYIASDQLPNDDYVGEAREVWEDIQIAEFVQSTTGNFIVRYQPVPAGVSRVYYDDFIIAEKEVRP
ncbi:SwmB domain-containing protein [Flavivirga abyssicola]|uniref:SwmB domain-containing protein n=1 Tax=Flavivirga abyssicola TaxID=3063533 RepID=UPI0026E0ED90|nr:SwmB domain-containing protein [Flavivirga sp. MEBiC07777]WVK13794.1 SwmB domain-containing protein [Flavivirga sp. MEBiC07777]